MGNKIQFLSSAEEAVKEFHALQQELSKNYTSADKELKLPLGHMVHPCGTVDIVRFHYEDKRFIFRSEDLLSLLPGVIDYFKLKDLPEHMEGVSPYDDLSDDGYRRHKHYLYSISSMVYSYTGEIHFMFNYYACDNFKEGCDAFNPDLTLYLKGKIEFNNPREKSGYGIIRIHRGCSELMVLMTASERLKETDYRQKYVPVIIDKFGVKCNEKGEVGFTSLETYCRASSLYSDVIYTPGSDEVTDGIGEIYKNFADEVRYLKETITQQGENNVGYTTIISGRELYRAFHLLFSGPYGFADSSVKGCFKVHNIPDMTNEFYTSIGTINLTNTNHSKRNVYIYASLETVSKGKVSLVFPYKDTCTNTYQIQAVDINISDLIAILNDRHYVTPNVLFMSGVKASLSKRTLKIFTTDETNLHLLFNLGVSYKNEDGKILMRSLKMSAFDRLRNDHTKVFVTEKSLTQSSANELFIEALHNHTIFDMKRKHIEHLIARLEYLRDVDTVGCRVTDTFITV